MAAATYSHSGYSHSGCQPCGCIFSGCGQSWISHGSVSHRGCQPCGCIHIGLSPSWISHDCHCHRGCNPVRLDHHGFIHMVKATVGFNLALFSHPTRDKLWSKQHVTQPCWLKVHVAITIVHSNHSGFNHVGVAIMGLTDTFVAMDGVCNSWCGHEAELEAAGHYFGIAQVSTARSIMLAFYCEEMWCRSIQC